VPSSKDFVPFRLEGGRFEAASAGTVGLPLEVAGELARYERLLIQVARGVWKDEHRTRKRVPKGFEDGLRLRLTGVEKGSVVPVLRQRDPWLTSQLFVPDEWVQRSHEVIAETIAAVADEKPLPRAFPRSATASLVQFGSSLRPDEAFVLERRNGPSVRYDQIARRLLASITLQEDIKFDGELIGRISGVDANRLTFVFVDRDGQRVPGNYEQHGLLAELKEVTERDAVAPFVRLFCRYSTDAEGRVSAIEDVRDIETVVSVDDPLGSRLRDLLLLRRGWLHGEGEPIDLAAVEWARDFAAEVVSAGLALHAFPTVDGGVLLEHQSPQARWTLEIDRGGDASIIVLVSGAAASPVYVEDVDVAKAVESFRTFVL
jgi:hypothetical protein